MNGPENKNMSLIQLTDCVLGKVVRRPSISCKTPYVADVLLDDDNIIMAHTAALGCCGLADKGADVVMVPVKKTKNVCKFKIIASIDPNGVVIGIDPKIAETLTHNMFALGILPTLENSTDIKREQTIGHSRFDFVGKDNNKRPFILEVKSVPLAKDRISYFPDGYRKRPKDTVSPRALKHIQHLEEISISSKGEIRTVMCYIIQRNDSSIFQPSETDPIYRDALYKALGCGVEVLPLQIRWTLNREKREMNAYLCDTLPTKKNKNTHTIPFIACCFGGRSRTK